jgi:hypothetical protein
MKRFLILGGLVSVLAIGIIAVGVAGAQEDTPGPADTEEGLDKKARVDHYLEVLADNLGVSVEDLEAALTQTQLDLIDEKVADGTLTEEEAAEIKEKIESGDAPYFPPFIGGGHHGPMHRIVVGIIETAADVLGMDVDELHEQLRDGSSLADIAEAQGMDLDAFKAGMLDGIKAKLDEKVADGTLTQEVADNMYERFSENIDDIVENFPPEGPFGGPGHFGPGSFRDGGPTDEGTSFQTSDEFEFSYN